MNRLSAAAILAVLSLASCSGPDVLRLAPSRLPSVLLSTHQVSASAYRSERQPAPGQVQVLLDSPRIHEIHIQVAHTARAVDMVDVVTRSDASAMVSVRFRLPAALGVGVYSDTVSLGFCEDDACRRPLEGGRQEISVQFVVIPDPATVP